MPPPRISFGTRCSWKPIASASPWIGNKLPAFSLEDYWSGEQRTNRDWAEKKYILNFFASW